MISNMIYVLRFVEEYVICPDLMYNCWHLLLCLCYRRDRLLVSADSSHIHLWSRVALRRSCPIDALMLFGRQTLSEIQRQIINICWHRKWCRCRLTLWPLYLFLPRCCRWIMNNRNIIGMSWKYYLRTVIWSMIFFLLSLITFNAK